MKRNDRFGVAALTLLACVGLLAAGCGKDERNGKQAGQKNVGPREEQASGKEAKGKHEGWWCTEHGVPENLCSLCMSEAEAKTTYKDKGDWCKVHDRAQSQCFKCDPKLYAKYEAMYMAKFNEKPPRPPEEEFQK